MDILGKNTLENDLIEHLELKKTIFNNGEDNRN